MLSASLNKTFLSLSLIYLIIAEDLSQWIIWVDDKVKCGSLSNNVPPASIVSTSCPAHTQGTFVSIYKRPIRKYISLCEVEVYGIPPGTATI